MSHSLHAAEEFLSHVRDPAVCLNRPHRGMSRRVQHLLYHGPFFPLRLMHGSEFLIIRTERKRDAMASCRKGVRILKASELRERKIILQTIRTCLRLSAEILPLYLLFSPCQIMIPWLAARNINCMVLIFVCAGLAAALSPGRLEKIFPQMFILFQGIYLTAAYAGMRGLRLQVILTASAVTAAAILCEIAARHSRQNRFVCMRRTILTGIVIVTLCLDGRILLTGSLFSIVQHTSAASPDDLSAHSDIVNSLLDESVFSGLSDRQKCVLLQKTADLEAARLGLADAPVICIRGINQNVSEGRVLSEYDHSRNTVIMDAWEFENADGEELFTDVCHECFHAAQHRYIDACSLYELSYGESSLPLFGLARTYENELENYTSEGWGYYEQQLETDARRYAEEEYELFSEAFKEEGTS